MPKALWELKDILRAGGSVEVDARNLATWELKDIARTGRGRVIFRGLR